MAKLSLPLCSIPTIADRDGQSAFAAHWLPFYGYWSPSGRVYTFPTMEAYQDRTMRLGGVGMPNIFQKDCCTCAAGGESPHVNMRAV